MAGNPVHTTLRKLVLYCKSFRRDVMRAKRLSESIDLYNRDALPFYVSVPADDLSLFRSQLAHTKAIVFPDEDIIQANSNHDVGYIKNLPGGLAQQIIKSEFWRLGISECYVCIDSDGEFIRDFFESDFIAADGEPYTVMNENKELLEFCNNHHYAKVRENFFRESGEAQALFQRPGKAYHFGMPAVWSAKVWMALEREILIPQDISFARLIEKYPYELRLYGETILKYRPINLFPCDLLFKTYFYEQQHVFEINNGYSDSLLPLNWLGVLKQSNWEGRHFGQKKNVASRFWSGIKRLVRNLAV